MNEKQHQGQHFILYYPLRKQSWHYRLREQTRERDRNQTQKKQNQKKHLRIYSKIFLLKKLISTIFLQEKKV